MSGGGKMIQEYQGGAIITRFLACGPKGIKMLKFVGVVNENLENGRRGHGAEGPRGPGLEGRSRHTRITSIGRAAGQGGAGGLVEIGGGCAILCVFGGWWRGGRGIAETAGGDRAIAGSGAPWRSAGLTFLAVDTRTAYLPSFDGADAGKTAHYVLRWVSTVGEKGAVEREGEHSDCSVGRVYPVEREGSRWNGRSLISSTTCSPALLPAC